MNSCKTFAVNALVIASIAIFDGLALANPPVGLVAAPTSTLTPIVVNPSLAPAPAPGPLTFQAPQAASSILPNRTNAGTRGTAVEGLSLVALVPDSLVFCAEDQPNFYFYQSAASKYSCIITITEPNKAKPLILLKSPPGVPPGIHAIRLSRLNVKLAPDVTYLWSVTVLIDPQSRSEDVIASGLVELKQPPPDFIAKLNSAAPSDRAALFAANGYWYDALQLLSDQIDRDGQNTALRSTRAALLKQVGLDGDKIESSSAALMAGQKTASAKP